MFSQKLSSSTVASAYCDDIRDARGLAQTCFHNQIQPYSTVSLRAVYRRTMPGSCKRQRFWQA